MALAVRRGVKRLKPCCLAWTPGFTSLTLLRSKRSRARCHSSWLWFLGRARSHAPRGIEIASPLSMLQVPLQGCQEFEAHPGRDGALDSFCTYLFPAAGAAGAVSFQLKGTREDESLSILPGRESGHPFFAVNKESFNVLLERPPFPELPRPFLVGERHLSSCCLCGRVIHCLAEPPPSRCSV